MLKTNCETGAHGQYGPEKWDCQESGENGLSRIWTFSLTTQPRFRGVVLRCMQLQCRGTHQAYIYVKHRKGTQEGTAHPGRTCAMPCTLVLLLLKNLGSKDLNGCFQLIGIFHFPSQHSAWNVLFEYPLIASNPFHQSNQTAKHQHFCWFMARTEWVACYYRVTQPPPPLQKNRPGIPMHVSS